MRIIYTDNLVLKSKLLRQKKLLFTYFMNAKLKKRRKIDTSNTHTCIHDYRVKIVYRHKILLSLSCKCFPDVNKTSTLKHTSNQSISAATKNTLFLNIMHDISTSLQSSSVIVNRNTIILSQKH